MRTLTYTILALLAFAANSVLCRLALRGGAIDAATFSAIRLTAGAVALLLVTPWAQTGPLAATGSWTSAGLLFLYAVPFSFAYARLTAGTGALVLFGCVQVTMMMAALRSGERPHVRQWIGLVLALAGLVYLVLPGLAAPPPMGAALMALAGFSWGLYSLRGRGTSRPLADTAGNFVRSLPMVFAVGVLARLRVHVGVTGAILAVVSGALTSGLGYVAWYAALGGLTTTRAAAVQLAVPTLAAAGGVLFLSETISTRFVLSTVLVLGGIALALFGRGQRSRTVS